MWYAKLITRQNTLNDKDLDLQMGFLTWIKIDCMAISNQSSPNSKWTIIIIVLNKFEASFDEKVIFCTNLYANTTNTYESWASMNE